MPKPKKLKPPVLVIKKNHASELEHHVLRGWFELALNLPAPIPEHPGIIGNGRFKFDFAWPFVDGGGIVVEAEGITNFSFSGRKSRHLTITGYTRDCFKYNWAAEQGWIVLRYTQSSLGSKAKRKEVAEQIIRVVSQYSHKIFDERCWRVQNSPRPYDTWCALWQYPPPPVKIAKPRKSKKNSEVVVQSEVLSVENAPSPS